MRIPGRRQIARALLAVPAITFAYAAFLYLTLPDVRPLKTTNPSTTAFIELRAREARARGDTPRRIQKWVPYSRISQHLKRAVLVAEDSRFWTHEGVDFEELKTSLETNWDRFQFVRGGSTITQQLAKNLYLSPSKDPIRKLRELLIARALEVELSKQRILELYLNEIEWGDGIYGAEAAARVYFHRSCADLSASEAALLAAAIPNPRLLNPGDPSARLRRRQQTVMQRMGAVTPPPVVAGPAIPPPVPAGPPLDPVPPVPDTVDVPSNLPGQPIPVPKGPGGKPPDGNF
jgi:monofunctional biosynthetic peptidoglycan transglycosylase